MAGIRARARPRLADGTLVYLARLVTSDIERTEKNVARFAPKPGQPAEEAAAALARLRRALARKRRVLAILADLTDDPRRWTGRAIRALPADYDPGEDPGQEGT
jgi:hypothetical protein